MTGDLEPKILKRQVMRRKDAKRLKKEADAFLGSLNYKIVEQAELADGLTVYLFDGEAYLSRNDDCLFPSLKNPNIVNFPSIIVDMGAIPYVCNGADVMAPGIVNVKGEFREDELLVIRDVQHGKALAIGRALMSSERMSHVKKGRAVKNLHHVGDELWNAIN